MKSLLRKYIQKQVFNVAEGLVKTHPIGTSKRILDRKFADSNLIVIEDVSANRLMLDVTNFYHFKELFILINNLGYFASAIDIYPFDGEFFYEKFSEYKLVEIVGRRGEYKKIEIVLEAKFDEQPRIPKTLFHVTTKNKAIKIAKDGIVPKSYSKLTYHPERIYLTDSIVAAIEFADKIKKKEEIYVILGIKTDLVPNMKIYDDPNYKLSGYYTLNNISPNALFFVREIKI